MSIVRALCNSDVTNLTVVAYGGPDVGLLIAAGKVTTLVYGFVSLDSIPLEPHFRAARQSGAITALEYDEGMFQWSLYAASLRLPFLPTRAGLGSDVMRVNPHLKTVRSPYADGEELVAMPAQHLDVALCHLNRADARGNASYLGPDLYFDDLFSMAAEEVYISVEKVVDTEDLGPLAARRIHRWMVDGVVEAPNGAHFTSCDPDYGRDERFQRHYADAAATPEAWAAFAERFLSGDEAQYQGAIKQWHKELS